MFEPKIALATHCRYHMTHDMMMMMIMVVMMVMVMATVMQIAMTTTTLIVLPRYSGSTP